MNCNSHSLCMRFPQHVSRTQGPRPNCGSASRQIAQMSPPSSPTPTARAGAAVLFASPSDIKLAVFSVVRDGGSDLCGSEKSESGDGVVLSGAHDSHYDPGFVLDGD